MQQPTQTEEKKASTSKCPFGFDTKSENKYSELAILRKVAPSASDVREFLLTKYLATALKQICINTEKRKINFSLRSTDTDIHTELVKELTVLGYVCVDVEDTKQEAITISIKW